MKKILMPAFILSAVIASGQTGIYVGASGNVHVQPKTLVYSEGGLNVADQTGVVTSDGHVQLDGSYTNAGDGTNVTLMYTDSSAGVNDAYGQLIIKQDQTTSGNVSIETPIVSQQDGSVAGLSMPFTSATTMLEIVNGARKRDGTLFSNNAVATSTNRYTGRYSYYQNNTKQQAEEVETDLIDPTTVYSFITDLTSAFDATFASSDIVFSGVPNAAASNVVIETQVTSKGAALESFTNLATSTTPRNDYREQFFTYVDDFIDVGIGAGASTTWGHNIYGFGNPYTSNISLTQLFSESSLTTDDIKGIAILASGSETELTGANQFGEQTTSEFYVQTCADAGAGLINVDNCAGSLTGTGEFILRPFGTFFVKFREGKASGTLVFSDNIKTFDYSGLFIPGSSATGNGGTDLTAARMKNSSNTVKSLNTASNSSRVKSSRNASTPQKMEVLRLRLNEGETELDDVFIAANPWATEDSDKQMDASVQTSVLKENERSRVLTVLSEDSNKSDLYINGINKNTYVGKPISLDLKTGETPGKQYSFKGNVRIGAENNMETTNFYLEDKKAKKIVRVGSDFDYSYVSSDNDTERFVVYYGQSPVDVDQDVTDVTDVVSTSSATIAKDASGISQIVFNGMTGNVKVQVYNIIGQLIQSEDNVSTLSNYLLNGLPADSGVYIVKITSENGEVTSKKIIK